MSPDESHSDDPSTLFRLLDLAKVSVVDADQSCRFARRKLAKRLFGLRRKELEPMCVELLRQFARVLADEVVNGLLSQ